MNLKYILMALCLSFTTLMASAGAEAEETTTALNVQLALSIHDIEADRARELQVTAIVTRGSHIADTPGTDSHIATRTIRLADVIGTRPELPSTLDMPDSPYLGGVCWTEIFDAGGIDGSTGTASTTDPLSIAPLTVRLVLTRTPELEAAAEEGLGKYSMGLHDRHHSERTLVIHPREFIVKGDETTWKLSGETLFVHTLLAIDHEADARETFRVFPPSLGKIMKPVA